MRVNAPSLPNSPRHWSRELVTTSSTVAVPQTRQSRSFDVALSTAPRHSESLKGIIAAYLQGSEARPERALPYAERLVAIDPSRARDVIYIRSLMAG